MQIVLLGQEPMALAHLICDLNGTLTVDGRLMDGVPERLQEVTQLLAVHLVTSDTYGTATQLGHILGKQVRIQHVATGTDKAAYARMLGPETVVAIGNGMNDVLLFTAVRLRIAVCGDEGLGAALLLVTDILVPSGVVALDLLRNPQRIVATLRR